MLTSFTRSFINLIFVVFLSTICFVLSAKAQQIATYPKVTGHFSVLHPIGTWNKDGFHDNFSEVYTLVFPFGMNILKNMELSFFQNIQLSSLNVLNYPHRLRAN